MHAATKTHATWIYMHGMLKGSLHKECICNFLTWTDSYKYYTLSRDSTPLATTVPVVAIIHRSTDGKSVCTMQEVRISLAYIDIRT